MEYAASFNRTIKVLTREVAKRYPTDPTVYRMQQRVGVATEVTPLFVIDLVGPYLFKYRDQIYSLNGAGNEDFFLTKNYSEEFSEAVDHSRIDAAVYILPKVQDLIRALPPAERGEYKDAVIGLLDDYVEYCAARKGLGGGAPPRT